MILSGIGTFAVNGSTEVSASNRSEQVLAEPPSEHSQRPSLKDLGEQGIVIGDVKIRDSGFWNVL